MRRSAILVVVLVGLLILGGSKQRSVAQEAPPEAAMPVLTGTLGYKTYANFGAVDAEALATSSVGLTIYQLELAPGASVAYPTTNPGFGAHLVESGALTLSDFSVDIMVTRAATHSGHAPAPAVTLPAGSEMRVGTGDGFLLPPLAAGEFRNNGSEPVVLAISALSPWSAEPGSNILSPRS